MKRVAQSADRISGTLFPVWDYGGWKEMLDEGWCFILSAGWEYTDHLRGIRFNGVKTAA